MDGNAWQLSSTDDDDDDEYYWNSIRNVAGTGRTGGSTVGRAPNIDRGRHEAGERLLKDYFGENPVYNDGQQLFLSNGTN
jgi:hypothetical protein